MSARFQRLLIILLSLVFLTTAILLILFNSKKNIIFFYTPSELISSNLKINDTVRIGGVVQKGSINKNNTKYEFIIMDNVSELKIIYEGLFPDLFREGQGAVIEGKLIKKNIIKASTVFAKHDENYMPASIKKQLEKDEYWRKNYK